MPNFILLALVILFNTVVMAQDPCQQKLDDLPVQAGGRVKPYAVLASETIKHLTGKSTIGGVSANEVFCSLSLSFLNAKPSYELMVHVEHVDLIKLLDLGQEKEIAFTALEPKIDTLRAEYAAQKMNNSYKKAISSLVTKYQIWHALIEGKLWTIPVNHQGTLAWHSLADLITNETLSQLNEKLTKAKADYIELSGDKYLVELTYHKLRIFTIALLMAVLGIFLVAIPKTTGVGRIYALILLMVQVFGMAMRVYISGRAPITNMYETVMFSGFGALAIALIITIWKKDKIFLLAGLGYNTLCLFMMRFSGGMLDEGISPLVPVLRDNFWLSTHVTTIILSYAALALSWMIANIVLYKLRFGNIESSEHSYYMNLIYTSIKVGIVLLAAGIILGGVWADYSWGRFWGWDPKETWSLIVLLFYMAVLHGKYTNWISNIRFINLAALGFLTVMMAWFGVNYILAAGLHTYGFSEGGAIFLGCFFLTQISYVIICNTKRKVGHA